MRYKVDTESIIRKALGLLGEMAKSPEQLKGKVGWLWEEGFARTKVFDNLYYLIGKIDQAETDSELAKFSQELVLFVEQGVLPPKGFSLSAIETAIDPTNEKYVKDNRAWLQNTVSQIRGLLDQMRGER